MSSPARGIKEGKKLNNESNGRGRKAESSLGGGKGLLYRVVVPPDPAHLEPVLLGPYLAQLESMIKSPFGV